MSVSVKLVQFLKDNGVKYEVMPHAVSYTAQETAASVHTPGKEVAKSVVITDGTEYVMAVVDAPHQIDLKKFSALSGMKKAALASEDRLRELFPDCEPGAMPPFGNLYDIKVFVDQRLEEDETITFNAGSHFEAIRLKYADFKKLAKPQVGDFAR